jgi:hypothetical protein
VTVTLKVDKTPFAVHQKTASLPKIESFPMRNLKLFALIVFNFALFASGVGEIQPIIGALQHRFPENELYIPEYTGRLPRKGAMTAPLNVFMGATDLTPKELMDSIKRSFDKEHAAALRSSPDSLQRIIHRSGMGILMESAHRLREQALAKGHDVRIPEGLELPE